MHKQPAAYVCACIRVTQRCTWMCRLDEDIRPLSQRREPRDRSKRRREWDDEDYEMEPRRCALFPSCTLDSL